MLAALTACTSKLDLNGESGGAGLETESLDGGTDTERDTGAAPIATDGGGATADARSPRTPDSAIPPTDAGGAFELVDTVPEHGQVDVSTTSALELTFSRTPRAGDGNIVLLEVLDEVIVEEVAVDSDQLSVSDRTVAVTWSSPLSHDTDYTVVINPGAIEASDGSVFSGLAEPGQFVFSTGPAPPLTMESTTPDHEDVNVQLGADIELSFSSNIASGPVGKISLFNADTLQLIEEQDVHQNPQITLSDNTLTFDPTEDLSYDTTYFVTLDEGAVRSTYGAVFEGFDDAETLTFTTIASPPPVVVATAPADDAVDVDPQASLVLQFDSPISVGSGTITLSLSQNDELVESIDVRSAAVTVTGVSLIAALSSPLDTATEYYVTAGAGVVTNDFGVPFAGLDDPETFSFTTATDAPPPVSLIGSTPNDDADDIPTNTDLTFIFSEAVTSVAGSITIFETADGAVVESIPVTDPSVTVTGDTVTVDRSTPLTDETEYYITIGSGAFVSMSGASFRGLLTPQALNFATKDPFSLLSTEPADDAENVSVRTSLTFTFSAPAEVLSGDIVVTGGGGVETIAVDGSQVSVDGSVLTVELNDPLDYEEEYSVTLEAAAVGELGGVPFPGITDPTTWNFTTAAACSSGEALGPNGNCFYVFADSEVDWAEARNACEAHDTDWDLASIQSSEVQAFVEDLASSEAPGEQLWIGATDLDVEDEWLWVQESVVFWQGGQDGSPPPGQFAHWKSDQPTGGNQHCARILSETDDWRWADAPCSETYGFLCEGPAN